MKKRILIIEDNCNRYFSLKQIIQSLLKVQVREGVASNSEEVFVKTVTYQPQTIIFKPQGSAVDLYYQLKKKNLNCRNCEIALLKIDELDPVSDQALLTCFEMMKNQGPKNYFNLANAA